MSDNNIPPFEIQVEIIKWIPDVKSLLQFRSVSKPWKSLIDSREFIAGYQTRHRNRRLLVRYEDLMDLETKYVSIVDDDDIDNDRFARHKFPLTLPVDAKQLIDPKLLGSSQGLFCFYSNDAESDKNNIAVMWNPSIRKSVTVEVPNVLNNSWYETIIGFGVSPHSSDPKLVKILTVADDFDFKPHQVELYSVSTGKWRTLSEDMLRLSVGFPDDHHVVIDEFICWLAQDRERVSNMLWKHPMILLFGMISEQFMEIYLPKNVINDSGDLSIYKLWESLAVLVYDFNLEKDNCHVWMMEGGVSDSFTKLYTITRPGGGVFTVLSYRNNGNPIIRIEDDMMGSDELYVYEPDSEQICHFGISGNMCTCYAGYYTETLLLLDH